MYSEKTLGNALRQKRAAGMTLRDIAAEFPEGITHADIQRGLKGDFPKSDHKRFILGLPALIPTPACGKCGQVHVRRSCPNGRKVAAPRRVAVRTDDMYSAARTILKNIDPEKIRQLVEILVEEV